MVPLLVLLGGARMPLWWPPEAPLTTPIFWNTCQLLQTSSQSLAFHDFEHKKVKKAHIQHDIDRIGRGKFSQGLVVNGGRVGEGRGGRGGGEGAEKLTTTNPIHYHPSDCQ